MLALKAGNQDCINVILNFWPDLTLRNARDVNAIDIAAGKVRSSYDRSLPMLTSHCVAEAWAPATPGRRLQDSGRGTRRARLLWVLEPEKLTPVHVLVQTEQEAAEAEANRIDYTKEPVHSLVIGKLA